ncbi:MAG TPA: carbamoyl phosphate synthase large subunit, partial [Actinobacteria bacterium]|nr:carbamoyl phosphate synthase large subunit [Actinomycetota bacterium]
LEANPRASRTVPFVSKATAVPVAKAAARVMVGESIADLRAEGILPAHGDGGSMPHGSAISVKEAVLPFGRFHGVDTVLGPEMKSTGEVMGIDDSFGTAFAKSQDAAFSGGLPMSGTAFVSLANRDKRGAIFPIKRLSDLGFRIVATAGTAAVLRRNGIPVDELRKQHEGRGPQGEPTTVDAILAGEIQLIVNTPYGVGPRLDGYEIRTAAVIRGVPCITTVQGLAAAVQGIDSLQHEEPGVRTLQEHAADLNRLRAAADIEEGR